MDSFKFPVQEVSRKHGFSRSTIYSLRQRWRDEGLTGLLSRSRAPKKPFRKVTPFVEALIVFLKKKIAGWGATRMRNVLHCFRIDLSEPTIRNIWKKHGLMPEKRKKRQVFSENIKGGSKNVYWQVDLLTFTLDDGKRFNALVAIDTFSRYITCLKAMEHATVENVIAALEQAFVREGRPRVIVTDNGSQFCARFDEHEHAFKTFLASREACHLRIPRGRPQKNGIVERAIQNVKVESLRPFSNTTIEQAQQRLFRYRNFYNFHRRHAGIGNKRPAELFNPYHRRYGRQFLRDVLTNDFEVSNM